MKKGVSPMSFLINAYKNYLKINYENSFVIQDEESNKEKLRAFVKSLLFLMKYKGIEGYNYIENDSDNSIDIFKDNMLVVTYSNEYFKNIKTETNLKLNFLSEWGLLLEQQEEKGLIAL